VKIRRQEIAASEAEIDAMTKDLNEIHLDESLPALKSSVSEWHEGIRSGLQKATSRRTFLLGAGGALAGAGVLAAVASTPGLAAAATTAATVTPATSGNPEAGLSGDLAVAALAASLENLAIYAYQSAITAATAGKLGTVPPAVVTFAQTALSQHTDHAAAWNSLLTESGKKAVTVTDPKLTPTIQTAFGKVTNVTQLGELALMLENIAAQTYQAEASMLKSKKAIQVASTIAPVEAQHAAILYFVLGMYPGSQTSSGTPLAFNPTSMAA
jgi:Ferritin-like domain